MGDLEKYCKDNHIDYEGMSDDEKTAFGSMIENSYGYQVMVIQYAAEELIAALKSNLKDYIDKYKSN